MESEKLLYSHEDYTIWQLNHIPKYIRKFLNDVKWGTAGTIYEHAVVDADIDKLVGVQLLVLKKGNELMATALFLKRKVSFGVNKQVNSFYIRYFAASPLAKGKGIIKKYGTQIMRQIRDLESEETAYLASVEAKNYRSMSVTKNAGYESIGTQKTAFFSRITPKTSSNCHLITLSQLDETKSLLRSFYKDYIFYHEHAFHFNDSCFVYVDNDEIVATIHVHKAAWKISRTGNFWSNLGLKVVGYIPILQRLIDPNDFKFLIVDGIAFKPGKSHLLGELMSHALKTKNLHSALFWYDEKSTLSEVVKTNKMGLLYSFSNSGITQIMASTSGFENDKLAYMQSQPIFLSGFDYI